MADYTDVISRTKDELSACGLKYHDMQAGWLNRVMFAFSRRRHDDGADGGGQGLGSRGQYLVLAAQEHEARGHLNTVFFT